ncbi:MAG: L-idonate 5-dehydrogenase [Hyphomicrobiales bacterium]|nr:MAG: L-idonate 5-dehydrogenase [Hyphomicrobiales bacterium]
MRAVVIHKAKDLRVEEYEIDDLGPGQVRIKMEAGGVCGSDLHYFNHGGFGTVRLREPMVLGHEVSGRIEALGEGVKNLEVGELVAVSPSRSCGDCGYCAQGLPNHCENMRFYGSAMPFPHIQGAFREVLVANARQCVKADGLTAGEAAMAEPLSVCLHATRRAGEMLGKRVLVTGCGPIGLLTILVARRAGATEIVATDLSENALTYAKAAGADRVINVADDPEALSEYEAGKGTFDVMFEASGANVALNAAILTMRPRGIVMQLGMGGDMTIPMQQITVKELDLRGCFRFHEEFHTAVALMQKGLINVKPLITHTMALDDALAAFEIANDRSQAIKAQISFI